MSTATQTGLATQRPHQQSGDHCNSFTGLVDAALHGNQAAWQSLHQRFSPLVVSVCRRHRLSQADADDVGQIVWLRLVQQLKLVRDPLALPGWIATTARNECLHVIKFRRRNESADPMVDQRFNRQETAEPLERMLRLELHRALLDGLSQLPAHQRELMMLLIADPELPYREIALRLDIPVGGIGPTRARCLQKLRSMPGIRSLMENALAA
jgi:RNA polymerase sigma factor (sigma-70 family)